MSRRLSTSPLTSWDYPFVAMGLRCLLFWSYRCECWGCLRISLISRSIRGGMFWFLSISLFFFSFFLYLMFWYYVCLNVKSYANLYRCRAVVSAGPYRDISEEGKFYAVVLEQTQNTVHASHETHMGTPWSWFGDWIVCFVFLFLSYVWNTGRVLIFFVHFFYHAIVSVFNLLWCLNIFPRSKWLIKMYSQDNRVGEVKRKKKKEY